jgi:hypothetical protein
MPDVRIATPRPPGGELAALARQGIGPFQLVYLGFCTDLITWGGWGSNPRPADYEKYGPVHRAHYLHGYHGAVPPIALLLLHRLAQLPVVLDGYHHRYHLAATVNHVVGVTSGQFAHDNHGNEADRQPAVATRRRLMIDVQVKAKTPAELGAVERVLTADLPLTRSTASSSVSASCTDDTGNHTDGTHCGGILRRAVP